MSRRTVAAWTAAGLLGAAAVALAVFKTHWFAEADLDRRPFPMRRIDLDFPEPPNGIEYYGRVRIDLYIGLDGKVDRWTVGQTTLPPSVVDVAVRAFSGATWQPGLKWGMDVRTRKVVEVDLKPPTRDLAPSINP